MESNSDYQISHSTSNNDEMKDQSTSIPGSDCLVILTSVMDTMTLASNDDWPPFVPYHCDMMPLAYYQSKSTPLPFCDDRLDFFEVEELPDDPFDLTDWLEEDFPALGDMHLTRTLASTYTVHRSDIVAVIDKATAQFNELKFDPVDEHDMREKVYQVIRQCSKLLTLWDKYVDYMLHKFDIRQHPPGYPFINWSAWNEFDEEDENPFAFQNSLLDWARHIEACYMFPWYHANCKKFSHQFLLTILFEGYVCTMDRIELHWYNTCLAKEMWVCATGEFEPWADPLSEDTKRVISRCTASRYVRYLRVLSQSNLSNTYYAHILQAHHTDLESFYFTDHIDCHGMECNCTYCKYHCDRDFCRWLNNELSTKCGLTDFVSSANKFGLYPITAESFLTVMDATLVSLKFMDDPDLLFSVIRDVEYLAGILFKRDALDPLNPKYYLNMNIGCDVNPRRTLIRMAKYRKGYPIFLRAWYLFTQVPTQLLDEGPVAQLLHAYNYYTEHEIWNKYFECREFSKDLE